MRAGNSVSFGLAGLLLLVSTTSILATPTYLAVPTGTAQQHTTGYADVYNSTQGLNYGKAKIEWHAWYDSSSQYWYYAYKVYNNEAGVTNDRTDDYHFGHVYDSGTFASINTFDIDLPVQIPGEYGTSNNLYVLSTSAGSSQGGNAWGPLVDQVFAGGQWGMTGVDWSATRGGGLTIDPTQWDNVTTGPSGGRGWHIIDAGDTSRTSQYFEIASKWAPGLVAGHVSTGNVSSNTTAFGNIYGPAIVPEPATLAILALGGLFIRNRKS
ncbi:MAG: PEP-CTERM sorting domain-containing protein [Sedimentisphaerales bacterium]|nr:PEP-CTERM sorting domain-containing protein [Sedimentisphaerales bacterium]